MGHAWPCYCGPLGHITCACVTNGLAGHNGNADNAWHGWERLLGPPPADDDRVALDGKQPLSGRGTPVVSAFDEDRSRVRTPDNLLNLAMFRRMAVTLTIA